MAKEWAKKFYKSSKWIKCRQSYIQNRRSIDGGLCEVCKDNIGYIVHHMILLTDKNINDPNITLNHEFLSYQCKKCHDKNEGHFYGNRKSSRPIQEGLMFNEKGELVKVR